MRRTKRIPGLFTNGDEISTSSDAHREKQKSFNEARSTHHEIRLQQRKKKKENTYWAKLTRNSWFLPAAVSLYLVLFCYLIKSPVVTVEYYNEKTKTYEQEISIIALIIVGLLAFFLVSCLPTYIKTKSTREKK